MIPNRSISSLRLRRLLRIISPIVIVLLLLVAAVLGVMIGQTPMSFSEAIQGLLKSGAPGNTLIIWELRLPRIVSATAIGAALGLSGAFLQSASRNPLASPDVLGISTGAGTFAVAVIVIGGEYGGASGTLAHIGLPVAALAGGTATAFMVYMLARRGSMVRLLLVGVGLQAMLGSITSWLLIKASIVDAGRAIVWLTGSLNGSNWYTPLPVLIALVLALPLAIVVSRHLQVLALGSDIAGGLGVRLSLTRYAAVAGCVVLAATATAAAGPVAFVALGAPQIAQRLWRIEAPPLIGSALTGAVITLWADWLGRVGGGSVTLPVGVVTAAIGAPLLVYLIADSRKENRL